MLHSQRGMTHFQTVKGNSMGKIYISTWAIWGAPSNDQGHGGHLHDVSDLGPYKLDRIYDHIISKQLSIKVVMSWPPRIARF